MDNDQKKYIVIVDPVANDRLFEHFEFLGRVSWEAAERLIIDLAKDMQSLEYMPYRNPVYARPYLKVGKYRYMVSCKHYLIVYQVIDDKVYIDDIQDSRQGDDKALLQ